MRAIYTVFSFSLLSTIQTRCFYGTPYSNSTGCFQFFRTPLNFTNALRFCRVNMHSHLVTPTSHPRNTQLQNAAMKLGIDEFWIGASNVDNDWEWLNGSVLQYSNFDLDAGYPKKTESQIGAVSLFTFSAKWFTKLDTIQLPFACDMVQSEEYDQGVIYRLPTSRALRFPYGGTRAPVVEVRAADQSVLYDNVGPQKTEIDTGDRVYMKPIGGGAPMSDEKPIVILNPRRIRKKVAGVRVEERQTEIDRTMREKEDEQQSRRIKANGNHTSTFELDENLKKSREKETKENVRSVVRTISRG